MKNYRKLVPIILVVLFAVSCYKLVSDSVATNSEYENYLKEARKYAEMGVTKYAIENYTKALEIKSDVEIYVEVAEYYESQEKEREHLSWCEEFLESYPTEIKAYECLLKAYMNQRDYASCYDILYTAEKRNIESEYLNTISKEIAYYYKMDFNSYDDVGVYSNNFCAIKSKDVWGFVDRYGEQRVAAKYVSVGAYTQSNFASVVNTDGEAYFIDKTGAKVMVAKETYKSFGLLVNNIIAAQKTNDKYTYLNQDFEILFGEYDYASTMNNGIAAVRNGEQWSIVDSNGKQTTKTKYSDIKLDEKQIAYRNDRLFVKTGEKYIMVNSSGKQIGNLSFEDAKVFGSESYTAVKINGKWCFIDKDGKLISEKQYEEARTFVNGLAAVEENGKWGFVDENETLVIECKFFETKDFNEKGSCFVKVGDKWQLLKLYRLNREG